MNSRELTQWIKQNKTNDISWNDFTDLVNKTFGCTLTKEGVRKRYRMEVKGTNEIEPFMRGEL